MHKFSKKGVSPIIATVLLVAITIAIGATTMAFIRSLSDTNLNSANEKSATIACGTDVSIDVTTVDNQYLYWLNYSSGEFAVNFHNKGIDIDGFRMTIIGLDGEVEQSDFNTVNNATFYPLKRDTYKTIKFPYNTTKFANASTSVDRFIFEPRIRSVPGKGVVLCSDSVLEFKANIIPLK